MANNTEQQQIHWNIINVQRLPSIVEPLEQKSSLLWYTQKKCNVKNWKGTAKSRQRGFLWKGKSILSLLLLGCFDIPGTFSRNISKSWEISLGVFFERNTILHLGIHSPNPFYHNISFALYTFFPILWIPLTLFMAQQKYSIHAGLFQLCNLKEQWKREQYMTCVKLGHACFYDFMSSLCWWIFMRAIYVR